MLVARRGSRLNQKNITAAHVLLDSHVGLAVRKRADRGLPERKSDVFANALGQLAVGCAAENFHFWLTRKHEGLNCRALCWLAMIKTCGESGLSRLVPAFHERGRYSHRPACHQLAHLRAYALGRAARGGRTFAPR